MESYGVVMARDVSLSYVDHPPLTWWLIGLVTHVFGSEIPIVVRAPFILLSIGSSWLLYRLTERLFGSRSALYAAAAFAFSPLFGLWTGALALTDGLTIFFLLASVSCLARIFFGPEEAPAKAWIIWLSAGLCLGLALVSNYGDLAAARLPHIRFDGGPRHSGVASAATALCRGSYGPYPFAAGVCLERRARMGIISLSGRSCGLGFRPPSGSSHPVDRDADRLSSAADLYSSDDRRLWRLQIRTWRPRGLVLYLLCRRSTRVFPSVMLWSSHSLRGFHWGAIGWVMLFPVIGDAIRRLAEHRPRWAKAWTAAIAGTYALALIVLISHAMTGWITVASRFVNAAPFDGKDPILTELFDWTDLRQDLERRHIDPTRTFVAGTRWESCAKAAYALNHSYRVLCLAPQNVHFTYLADPAAFLGQDALIVDLSLDLKGVKATLETEFDSIEELPPVALTYFGRRIMPLRVYRGTRFHGHSARNGNAAPHLIKSTGAMDASR